jgi:hypothetical protein
MRFSISDLDCHFLPQPTRQQQAAATMEKDAPKKDAMQKLRVHWQNYRDRHSSSITKLSDFEVQEAVKAILKIEKLITSWSARRTASLEDSAALSGQKEIWERYEHSKEEQGSDVHLLKQHLISSGKAQPANLAIKRRVARPVYEAFLRVQEHQPQFSLMYTAMKDTV